MSISTLSSAQLAHLVSLVKVKKSLEIKLGKVDAALSAIESGKKVRGKRGRPPGKAKTVGRKPGKRGKRLKAPMLKALAAAGASGITVKELAAKLKVKPGNIFSWFYTTGKKVKGITKVGEAKYAYSS
jgi:hypothetical protein